MKGLPPEERLVSRLATVFGTRRRDVLLGIGDDAAVVAPGKGTLVVTTDLLAENEDFRADSDPRRLGRKAISVNASDLAAMGATPLYATVCLAVPAEADPAWLEAFAQGVRSAANDYGLAVIGGDLSASRLVFISVTAIGRGPAKGVLTRSGARARDTIWISGTIGAGAAGLALLEAGYRLGVESDVTGPRGRRVAEPRGADLARMIRHQADPRAMVQLGKTLAEGGLASAAIDVSDGLAKDLHGLCRASGVGARIDGDKLPLDSALVAVSEVVPFDPRTAALYGGEDYGLLFTVPKRSLAAVDRLAARFALRMIGEIVPGGGVTLVSDSTSVLLPDRGFDHFGASEEPAGGAPARGARRSARPATAAAKKKRVPKARAARPRAPRAPRRGE